jgi:hypothetical protein
MPHIKGSLFHNKNRMDLREFTKIILQTDVLDPVSYKDHELYQTITIRKGQ